MTKYISSGQAFFIRANAASPQITFTENAKVSTEGNNYFRNSSTSNRFPSLKINLVRNPEEMDESLIVFYPDGSYKGNDDGDMLKFFNNALNLYSKSSDGLNMSMNAIPNTNIIDTVKLSIWSYDSSSIAIGQHVLFFENLEDIPSNQNVYLVDHYLSIITDIRKNNNYVFLITSDANSYGNNRFEIIFNKTNTTVPTIKSEINNLVLFPNPSSDIIYIQSKVPFSKVEEYTYELFDLIGNKIMQGALEFKDNTTSIHLETLNKGIYVLRLYNNNEYKTFKLIKE